MHQDSSADNKEAIYSTKCKLFSVLCPYIRIKKGEVLPYISCSTVIACVHALITRQVAAYSQQLSITELY